ncbi:Hypothetical_protein [Hexamita inflata]|uniref:Hypothetical_protein n=1 Tax=Hexamita inflata TaxID=28002 RepID=A0AA86UMA2_9EUKA|nr:Hypothetical protein HINF_LOCUS44551 [Hexamita inflata]
MGVREPVLKVVTLACESLCFTFESLNEVCLCRLEEVRYIQYQIQKIKNSPQNNECHVLWQFYINYNSNYENSEKMYCWINLLHIYVIYLDYSITVSGCEKGPIYYSANLQVIAWRMDQINPQQVLAKLLISFF